MSLFWHWRQQIYEDDDLFLALGEHLNELVIGRIFGSHFLYIFISMHRALSAQFIGQVRHLDEDKKALHREVLSQPYRRPKVLTSTFV